jgi:uncharacterized protein YkwD|tara:strand:+ start:528 stop:1052 length:525 start_codon:yes stop_codon:yes gene_type:complete
MFKIFLLKKRYIFVTSFFLLCIGCVSNNKEIYIGNKDSGRIENFDSVEIRKRHLDYLNAIRQERGLTNLQISNSLNSSAATHARDIFKQQRAWNFGSDGSSPQKRAEISGFKGVVTGENVSETYEGEFLVLQVWVKNSFSRSVLLNKEATHLGLGWYQQDNGKIWWVQVLGLQK